jgi:hypothetical protein
MFSMDRPGGSLQVFDRYLKGIPYGLSIEPDPGIPKNLPYIENKDDGENNRILSRKFALFFCVYFMFQI